VISEAHIVFLNIQRHARLSVSQTPADRRIVADLNSETLFYHLAAGCSRGSLEHSPLLTLIHQKDPNVVIVELIADQIDHPWQELVQSENGGGCAGKPRGRLEAGGELFQILSVTRLNRMLGPDPAWHHLCEFVRKETL
jgi:hypothetical protein